MLRYSRLSNPQVLAKLLDVCDKENVNYTEDGLEAIVFTAQGDMRQALNNLQVRLLYTIQAYLQKGTNIRERLLNKPYVNDVTLRGQKSPLKCC